MNINESAEALASHWSIQRVYRFFTSLGAVSWLLIAVEGTLLLLVATIFFRLGQQITALPLRTIDEYALAATVILGLWTGYGKVNGHRPPLWRLLNRASWAYRQIQSGLAILIVGQLITAVAFALGESWTLGTVWWQAGLLAVSYVTLATGIYLLGAAIGVLVKIIARDYLVRAVLAIMVIFAIALTAPHLNSVINGVGQVWTSPNFNGLLLVLLTSFGLLGIGLALCEIVFPHQRVTSQPANRYWRLPLPTRGWGFGNGGLALGWGQIVRSLRSTQLQRQFLLAVIIALTGVLLIPLGQRELGPQNTATAIIGSLILSAAYFGLSVSFIAGRNSRNAQRKLKSVPVKLAQISAAYYISALIVTIVGTAILIELFQTNLTWPLAGLVMETAIVVGLCAFQFGQLAGQLKHRSNDQLTSTVLTHLGFMLVAILVLIFISFNNLLTPLSIGWLFVPWVAAALAITIWGESQLANR